MGFESISNIVKKKKMEFLNHFKFLSRTDSKNLNKLQLEGLIKSGSLDVLDKNRESFLIMFLTI